MRIKPLGFMVPTLILIQSLTGTAALAATAGHPGIPIAEVPQIRDGYGLIDVETITSDNDVDGTPSSCGDAQGASAFHLAVPHVSVLDLTATTSSGTLCRIDVYRADSNGMQIADLYDPSERTPYELAKIPCTSANCTLSVRVPPTDAYLVVWPSGDQDATATTRLEGFLRLRPHFYARVPDRKASPCFPVRGLADPIFESFTLPAASPGDITMQRVHEPSGATVTRTDPADQVTEVPTRLWPAGRHTITVSHPGNDTVSPGSVTRCVDVARKMLPKVTFHEHRYTYDDYGVWNDGDTVIISGTFANGLPKTGKVIWRMERQYASGHRYKPWALHETKIVNGATELRLRATYRPNGLPFYRIRPEVQNGPQTIKAIGAWRCIQFNRA
jgi:hypothetical protein